MRGTNEYKLFLIYVYIHELFRKTLVEKYAEKWDKVNFTVSNTERRILSVLSDKFP